MAQHCKNQPASNVQTLQIKNYDCLIPWMICRLSLTWRVSCVKNRDRWTYELAVLQGQIVIALLLSHATVSKRSVLSLFHHILHINKIAREWSEGDKERKRREGEGRRGKRERDTNWSFGGEISHSHPGRMDECLWWPLQVQAGRVSENKRNWFGPSGGESMCEGHVSAVVLFCAGLWGLSKVWGVSDVTAELSFASMFYLLLSKQKSFKVG